MSIHATLTVPIFATYFSVRRLFLAKESLRRSLVHCKSNCMNGSPRDFVENHSGVLYIIYLSIINPLQHSLIMM
jgi:hypothetical protein